MIQELTVNRSRDGVFATVLVGPNHVKFVVHESLLIHYSDFFRAALTGNFSEAKDKIVRLEEDDPETFEVFVHWLYYQRFPDKNLGDDVELVNVFREGEPSNLNTCASLHIFGDKYGIKQLARDTIDDAVSITIGDDEECLPSPFAIEMAFEHLRESSPMCRLIVDAHCFYGAPDTYDTLANYKCIPFLHGLWARFANLCTEAQDDSELLSRDIVACDYHEHEDDKEKEACKKEQKNARARERALASAFEHESESETER